MTKEIANRVRLLREQRNINQADMGRQLGLTQSHWSAIENGKHPFDVEMLQAISDLYGVSMLELLYGVSEGTIGARAMVAILGRVVKKAYEDPKFRELVAAMALAHRTKSEYWMFEACRRILQS